MADSYGSRAVSSGYKHKGPAAGAPVVATGGPGNGKSGVKAAGKSFGVQNAASGSAPKGMSVYKEGQGR